MTTAIFGTGGIGSAIARQLASGADVLQLSSPDKQSAQRLAAAIGGTAVVAVDNRSALQGADAVILALRFSVRKDVIARSPTSWVVSHSSFRVTRSASTHKLRSCGSCRSSSHLARLLPGGCRRGHAWPSRLAPCRPISSSSRATGHPEPAVLFYVTDEDRGGVDELEWLVRTAGFEPMKVGGINQSSQLEVGGDLHDLVISPAEARSLIVWGLITLPPRPSYVPYWAAAERVAHKPDDRPVG